jgi:hypothetical protein
LCDINHIPLFLTLHIFSLLARLSKLDQVGSQLEFVLSAWGWRCPVERVKTVGQGLLIQEFCGGVEVVEKGDGRFIRG